MRIEVEPGVRLYVDIEGAGSVPTGAPMRDPSPSGGSMSSPTMWCAFAMRWASTDRSCSARASAASRRTQPPGASCCKTEILFAWIRAEQFTMDLRSGLSRVQCPVLVMAGGADPVTPIEDAEEIVAALRHDRVRPRARGATTRTA